MPSELRAKATAGNTGKQGLVDPKQGYREKGMLVMVHQALVAFAVVVRPKKSLA